MAFVSQEEPKNLNEALKDNNWILAMQEELNQFALNKVWSLVPRIPEMNIIGTKWVFINKMDEHGVITINKARLVAKGYNQEEGIDYDETYAPVARLEAVILLLAFSYIKGFKLFQKDVKSAFLNGYINEEFLFHNHQDLKTINIQNMCSNSRKLFMGLSKLLDNGMRR